MFMVDCLAFIALAELQPSFTALVRGAQRLEEGHISHQAVRDTRTFLKAQDGAHYYLVESEHGPQPRYVEKVTQRGLAQEFCGLMDVAFTQQGAYQWVFDGLLKPEMGGGKVMGSVDLSKSYFYNHVWVESPELLRLEVKELAPVALQQLDLTQVVFCEEGAEGHGIACSGPVDMSALKD